MNAQEQNNLMASAQYRKSLSIAFFSATNAAIELVKTDYVKDTDLKKFIIEWRNFFLEEHKSYYAQNIANIGVNYDVKATLEKLEKAKTVDELKSVWVTLSQDERQDEQVKAKAQLLKTQLS